MTASYVLMTLKLMQLHVQCLRADVINVMNKLKILNCAWTFWSKSKRNSNLIDLMVKICTSPEVCRLCRLNFRTKRNLRRHWTIENWIWRACNFCDESFERLSYAQKHLRLNMQPMWISYIWKFGQLKIGSGEHAIFVMKVLKGWAMHRSI